MQRFKRAGKDETGFLCPVTDGNHIVQMSTCQHDPSLKARIRKIRSRIDRTCLLSVWDTSQPGRCRYALVVACAIRRHDSAHRRHISAHCFIILSSFPIRSQFSAHAMHTSAQTPHVRGWRGEPRSMKSALVWQIWAQSSSSRMWSVSACLPPFSKQCWAVSVQIAWQRWQFCKHSCICWLVMRPSMESFPLLFDVLLDTVATDRKNFVGIPTVFGTTPGLPGMPPKAVASPECQLPTYCDGWRACPTGTGPSA